MPGGNATQKSPPGFPQKSRDEQSLLIEQLFCAFCLDGMKNLRKKSVLRIFLTRQRKPFQATLGY